MHRSHHLVLAAALGLGLSACTDTDTGPDVTGVWAVTAHTQNPTGCGAGDVVTDPPYIKFTREEILGQHFYAYADCVDAGINCEQGGGLFGLSYTEGNPDGWRHDSYGSVPSGTGCVLSHTVSDLVVTGQSLTIDTKGYELTDDTIAEDDCSLETARSKFAAGALGCTSAETLAATRAD